jgi:hypothetical protein
MADIFISYATADRERARTVARALQARGWSVWWDRDVKAGQAFDQVIESELEAAKSVVVLWSQDSVASDWVKSEAAAAVRRGVLVPARIGNVRLPIEFSRRQTADLIGWDGDTSHAGFQALCDGMAGIAGMPPPPTPDASEIRQSDSWNQKRVLKGWWQTLPGVATAVALLVALAALVATLNQASPSRTDITPTPQVSVVAPSRDRDKPTWLTSNEIRDRGVGERVSYYYAFNGGPGTIKVTVDGKSRNLLFVSPISIELSDMDARPILDVHLVASRVDQRVVDRVELHRQEQVILRVLLHQATIDYMVRLDGAVDFRPVPTPPR